MTQTILIIDDEKDIRDLLGDIFTDEGYSIVKAAHSEQALALINANQIDLIVLDIWLDNSDMDGMQILKHLKDKKDFQYIPVLMISGHGNVEMAVNAMKVGAFDFIEKPFKIDHILLTVQRALEQKSLTDDNHKLQDLGDFKLAKHEYKSSSMVSLMKSVNEHADSDARVLITGPIGVGKTRLARLTHEISKRSKSPIRYTHANDFSLNKFEGELNHNPKGTLVFESVDKLNSQHQADLLQYLNKLQNTSRIIFTSGIEIDNLIKSQKFSSALYDRIAIIRYNIPSLQNRLEDIDILINEFIKSYEEELGICVRNDFLSSEKIKNFSWHGNVKQLKTAVEWMVFCQINCGSENASYMLPLNDSLNRNTVRYQETSLFDSAFLDQIFDMPLKEARDIFELKYLSHMLEKYDGNIARVANAIDMDRTALHRKLKAINLTFEAKIEAENT